MTLKAVVDTLDDIPEALKVEYKEKDGKFHLDLDGTLETHTSILPLANSLKNAKTEKATLQAKVIKLEARVLGLPDDFDPAKYQDLLTEIETLRNDPNRDKDSEKKLTAVREQYEQRIRAAEEKRLKDLADKDKEIGERDRVIESTLVDDGLTQALVKAGVGPAFLAASKALLRGQVKVKRDDAGTYKAAVDTDLGEIDVEKFVDNWSKSDDGKPFVTKASGGGGNGSGDKGGGSEVNPWAKDTLNRTEQGRILIANKPKAERLMKAAGIPAATIAATLGS